MKENYFLIFQAIGTKKYQDVYGSQDQNGINEAYRVVADHMRMATVAIGDGLRPGKRETE